jgi:hypothetical protein
MKKCIIVCGFLTSLFYCAQVGINTNPPDKSAIFDMSDSKRGFLAPRVALKTKVDTETIVDPKDGLVIFNTTDNNTISAGYYYWNRIENSWIPFYNKNIERTDEVTNLMLASNLGYNPTGKGDTSPDVFSLAGITATKKACLKYTDTFGNAPTHSYCFYNLDANIDWAQAFVMAKFLKGYLGVITTSNEWDFVKNALSTISSQNANNSIWMGYSKIAFPGNPSEYTWITGERSTVSWSNDSTLETGYSVTKPNLSKNCIRIKEKSTSVARNWIDEDCSNKNSNFLIVEFNN